MTISGRTNTQDDALRDRSDRCGDPPALAQKGLDEPFQGAFKESLRGKTVAYVPVAMNFDLTEGWFAGVKKELEPYGVKVIVRDPNWSTNAGAQAVTTLISEKPAAMIIHNPDVQTYAKLLQRAENEGIYVIQINMGSSYRSSAFVGANWIEIGERDTEAVVKACQGKSNKIAIVQGALSAAASAYTLKGVENVLAKNPDIKVVSSQAADWDAAKAKAITQTVLKQNPDLCGIVGFWDGMDIGTAAAVKEAGLTGKVFVATSGGGERRGACELVKSGAFDLNLSYDVPTQAEQMAGMIKWLVSSGVKAGIGEGIDVYDPDPDHQGERRERYGLLESQRSQEVDNRSALNRRAAVRYRVAARPKMERADRIQITSLLHPGPPMQDALLRLRYRYWPDHLLGEILSKRWTETAIPVIVLLIITIAAEPVDRRLSFCRQPRRYRTAGRRNRFRRARHGHRRHRRRHRPFGGIDVRAVRLLRTVLPQCSGLARTGGDRCDDRMRRGARGRQRPVDRISAAARLHHDADHADYLPVRLRPAVVRLFKQDRRRLPRHPVLEFPGRRRACRRTQRCAGLYRRRHLRTYLPDRVCDRDGMSPRSAVRAARLTIRAFRCGARSRCATPQAGY